MQFKTKKDIVVSRLREAILSGELEPGEKLVQADIARQMGISATPIREAIRELQADGMLDYEAHRGVVVTEVDLDTALEIYEMREMLESRLTGVACPNLTTADIQTLEDSIDEMQQNLNRGNLDRLRKLNYQFHWCIYEAAGRQEWNAEISRLWTRFPWDTLTVIPSRPGASFYEHQAILECLKARDAAGAVKSMVQHIRGGFRALEEYLSKQSRNQEV